MAHAQKPDFVFRRNGRVHLNRQCQFSRLLAAEVWATAVVMMDTPCSEVEWRVLPTNSIRQFPLHFPTRASPCVVTFQLDSTYINEYLIHRRWLCAVLRRNQQILCCFFLIPLELASVFLNYVVSNKNSYIRSPKLRTTLLKYYKKYRFRRLNRKWRHHIYFMFMFMVPCIIIYSMK